MNDPTREAVMQYYIDAFIESVDMAEVDDEDVRREIRKLIREVIIEFKGEEVK